MDRSGVFKYLIIMKKDSGIPLYVYNPKEGEIPDSNLISGLVTALRGLGEELGYQLDSVNFRDKKLSLVTKQGTCGFLIADKITQNLREMLSELVDLFISLFGEFENAIERGEYSRFTGFTKVLDYVLEKYTAKTAKEQAIPQLELNLSFGKERISEKEELVVQAEINNLSHRSITIKKVKSLFPYPYFKARVRSPETGRERNDIMIHRSLEGFKKFEFSVRLFPKKTGRAEFHPTLVYQVNDKSYSIPGGFAEIKIGE